MSAPNPPFPIRRRPVNGWNGALPVALFPQSSRAGASIHIGMSEAEGPEYIRASIFVDIIRLRFTLLSFAGVVRPTARRAAW
jgi:hypothetical protein